MLNLTSRINPDAKARLLKTEKGFIASTELLQDTILGLQSVRSEPLPTAEEAIAYLKGKLQALKEREEGLIANPLNLLEYLCSNHDWTYMFSDDHSKWQAGQSMQNQIARLVKQTGDAGKLVYEKFAPKSFN